MKKLLILLPAIAGGILLAGCVDDEAYRSRAYGPRAAYYGGDFGDEPYYVNGGVQYYYSGGRYYYLRDNRRYFITELPSGGRYLHAERRDERALDRRDNRERDVRFDRNRVQSVRNEVQDQQQTRRSTRGQQVIQQEYQTKGQKDHQQTVKKGDQKQADHKKKGDHQKQDDQQLKRDQ
jgi:hypothetical protein